jgi:hypothetical protein
VCCQNEERLKRLGEMVDEAGDIAIETKVHRTLHHIIPTLSVSVLSLESGHELMIV